MCVIKRSATEFTVKRKVSTSVRRVRALSACACLVALLLGMPGVLPGLLGALATMDGSHQVIVGEGASDGQLILHHRTPITGTVALPPHRHGVTARLLVMLASPGNPTTDHVLKFSACRVLLSSGEDKVERTNHSANSFETPLRAESAKPLLATRPALFELPPPSAALQSLLRSTVLLI